MSPAAAPARPDAVRGSVWLGGLAALLAILGAALVFGGVWLISLGGSWYYALAGAALLVDAWLLLRRNRAALSLYAAILLATMIWALAEVGFDFWQLAPRGDLLAPIGVLLILPWTVRPLERVSRWPGAAWPLIGVLCLAVVVAVVAAFQNPHDIGGRLPGPRLQVSADGALGEGDWAAYGGAWRGNRWSPLSQITPANVDQLEKVWEFHTGDMPRESDPAEFTFEVTPLKVGELVYLCSAHNIVFALDAETGEQVWRFDPQVRGSEKMQHLTCRGVSYFAREGAEPGGACARRIVMGTNDARLIEVDALTGRPCAQFGQGGQIDVWPGEPSQPRGWWQITSPPVVAGGLIITGGAIYDNRSNFMPSGVIRAFDAETGEPAWAFDPGDPGNTSPRGSQGGFVPSSANSWTISAADEELGLVYVPMGMAAVDQWGGRRSDATERFATSVVALEIATGRPRWVFQTVHHDLWDMDVPAQPALVDLWIPGRGMVPALVQSTKTGDIYVLDRRTGQPVLPVTERRVPGDPAPGDYLSPTQPFSSVSLMPDWKVDGANMWGATMLDQLACRIEFAGLRYEGPYTPPSLQGTLVFPGNFGVMDWGGMAIDPERMVAFAHPNYMGFVDRLIPSPPTSPRTVPSQMNPKQEGGDEDQSGMSPANIKGFNPNAGAPFAVALNPFLSPFGLPCQAPPWGYVAGIDLVTGETVWKHRNGTIRDQSPAPLPFELGVPSLGGPVITAGGVAFMGSALDYYLRAYDTATGEVLWESRLPAGGQASPMSYWSDRSGRQFVVIAAGGHGSLGTKQGDSVIAYALPRDSAPRVAAR